MKPWLLLPPKAAHDFAPLGIRLLASFRETNIPTWRPFTWKGLSFPNRVGLAGGVDKDGEVIEEWWKFGPGFIEIGTVTPRAQDANPGKIIDRDLESFALWNKMGFPGSGVHFVRQNLKDLPPERPTPIFVNIGKNRDTANELAAHDYAECMSELSGIADAFVVNISSPNTQGLRELLQPKNLHKFLGQVLSARNKTEFPSTPVLLKISPDLENENVKAIVEVAGALGVDGFIATNTTLSRDHGSPFPAEGGVSGRPLAKKSKETLRSLISALGSAKGERLVVSVGGVLTPEDVEERLAMGADLVQVYSALTFEGPMFFKTVAKHMSTSGHT